MARPLRIEYSGAWYHVMNRGLARNLIFLNDLHRHIFLELLNEIHNRYQAEIYAYCLMHNHYHLLIRTPLGNISRIMRHLDGVYTQRFNRTVKRDGPLFRGRFKAILVDAEVYLLRLSRYIHLNPVKACLVSSPENFQWSSYPAYLSCDAPYWLNTKYILNYFDENLNKYKAFIEEDTDREIDDFYKKLKNIPILGTETFTKTITEKYLKEEHKIDDIPEHKLLMENNVSRIEMKDIISSVSAFYHLNLNNMHEVKKSVGNKPRLIAMYLACTLGQYTFSKISQNIGGVTTSGVSRACARLEERMHNNSELRKEVEEVFKFVSAMSNVKT